MEEFAAHHIKEEQSQISIGNREEYPSGESIKKRKGSMSRGPNGLRLSEFVQISEFSTIYIKDICQTSESFAKSVNLKKESAERTIPSVEATGILR